MNNLLIFVGIAAVALYFKNQNSEIQDTLDDYKSQLQEAQDEIDDLDTQVDYYTDKTEAIKKYLKASLWIGLATVRGTYKSDGTYVGANGSKNPDMNLVCKFTFKNDSGDVNIPYLIRYFCADLTINGHEMETFIPAYGDVMKVNSGQSASALATWQGEELYEDGSVNYQIAQQLAEAYMTTERTKDDGGLQRAVIDGIAYANIHAKVNAGGTDLVVDWDNVEVPVYAYKPGTEWIPRGQNALNYDKYDDIMN